MYILSVIRSDCVVATLEGPGIAKSECPTCHQPVWKKDLKRNLTYENLIDKVTHLLEHITRVTQGELNISKQ